MRRSCPLMLAVAACAADPADAPSGPGEWASLAEAPTARSEAAVALARGEIVTVGGFSDVVELYDVAGDTWRAGTSFVGRTDHITAVSLPDGNAIFIAGWNGQGGAQDRTFTYDPSEDAFVDQAPLPRKVGAGALVRVGGTVYLFGGTDGGEVTDLQIYDVASNTWRVGPPMQVARHHLAAAEVGGKIYVVGGRSRASFILDTVEVFDTETETWSMGPPLQVARSGHAAAAARGRVYVFGGEGSSYAGGVFPEVEVLDPETGVWSFSARMKTPRHGIGAVAIDDRIYVPIGANRQGLNNVNVNEVLILP